MTKLVINGVNGKVGQIICRCVKNIENVKIAAGVDKFQGIANDFPVYDNIKDVKEDFDVIIDFSRPDALEGLLEYSKKKGCGAVIATTGCSEEQKAQIKEYSQYFPLFYSANMSLGVNLQIELCKKAAEFLGEDFDIEIIEKHHNQKVDAPSGTALAIADGINEVFHGQKEYVYGRTPEERHKRQQKEIGLHAVRGGTVVGEHDVGFYGHDEIIQILHTAQSREVFAIGAIRAANFINGKKPGLYNMSDIIAQSDSHNAVSVENNVSAVFVSGINPLHAAHALDGAQMLSMFSHGMSFVSKKAAIDVGLIKDACEHASVQVIDNLSKITFKAADADKKAVELLCGSDISVVLFSADENSASICVPAQDAEETVKLITENIK